MKALFLILIVALLILPAQVFGAAATNNLLLTTKDLDEFALDLNTMADADTAMTPVADGATGNTFRFTWTAKTVLLVKCTHDTTVTFTIAGDDDVLVPGYGEVDMPDIAITCNTGDVSAMYGIITCPNGYADSGIVTVTVTYANNAADGSILVGAFAIKNK